MKHLIPIAAALIMAAAPLTAQDNKVEKTAAKPVVVMEQHGHDGNYAQSRKSPDLLP